MGKYLDFFLRPRPDVPKNYTQMASIVSGSIVSLLSIPWFFLYSAEQAKLNQYIEVCHNTEGCVVGDTSRNLYLIFIGIGFAVLGIAFLSYGIITLAKNKRLAKITQKKKPD